MQKALDETNRRRRLQTAYNKKHGITPETIQKENVTVRKVSEPAAEFGSVDDLENIIQGLESEMKEAVKELVFERAAELRDRIKELRELDLDLR
jgi:excinuclease ABC subunit B